ncbi:group II trans-sialidase superfamily, partial [Trypanosoma conorhini]
SAALLLLVVLICCGGEAVHAEGNKPKEAQLPQSVELFVPNKTKVEGQAGRQTRDFFLAPSLASAGGVLAAFAEGHITFTDFNGTSGGLLFSDVVAGYINAAESWASLVAAVDANQWKAYSIFSRASQVDHVGRAFYPTTVAKNNKVFLLVGSHYLIYNSTGSTWTKGDWSLALLVGEPTQGKQIQWGQPQQLLPQIAQSAQANQLDEFSGAGGSGVAMASGALVFPVVATQRGSSLVSTIIYSTDEGQHWVLPKGMLPGQCASPLLAEWEAGQLLMIADCVFGRRVFESRDMGATWAETVRALSRVRGDFRSDPLQRGRRVGSLTTATIAGTRLMLYTQKEYPLGATTDTEAKDLFLWATDNNRTFRVGPISMDAEEVSTFAHALLYSNDKLHFLQERGNETSNSLGFAPLTEELKTITSVLDTWAELDSDFSKSSVPTAGLVGFLSDASSDATWDDAYRCLNAVVKNAKKVKNGFEFTGAESYAFWPVNMWQYGNLYDFVNYEFTLVATVTIHQAPKESAPLLGASLEARGGTKFVGLAYTATKKWETVLNGTATAPNGNWEPGKKYQVALMLQGNKASVYVDGELVGSSDALPTPGARGYEISHFYFGDEEGGNDRGGSVTVTDVLLYNRRLSATELNKVESADVPGKAVNDRSGASGNVAGTRSSSSEKAAGGSSASSEKVPGGSSASSEKVPAGSSASSEKVPAGSSSSSEKAAGGSSSSSEKAAVGS